MCIVNLPEFCKISTLSTRAVLGRTKGRWDDCPCFPTPMLFSFHPTISQRSVRHRTHGAIKLQHRSIRETRTLKKKLHMVLTNAPPQKPQDGELCWCGNVTGGLCVYLHFVCWCGGLMGGELELSRCSFVLWLWVGCLRVSDGGD